MKIALWDIETAKIKFSHFGYSRKLLNPYLPSDAIERPLWLPCASWKFLGNDRIYSACVLDDKKRFKKEYHDDYIVIKALWDLMHEADVIVAHNGDNFDWKKFTARCAIHNLKPPPRPQFVDTLKVARSCFGFDANDLRFLARVLKVPVKKENPPDWDLIAIGDEDEIKRCLKYNRQDIRVLEPIYLKLRPWMKNHPKMTDFHCFPVYVCPTCASPELMHQGTRSTKKDGKFNRYQCKECLSWIRESDLKKGLKR